MFLQVYYSIHIIAIVYKYSTHKYHILVLNGFLVPIKSTE